MTVVKFFGIITLFSVCSVFGIRSSLRLKRRAEQLGEIERSLQNLKTQISYSEKELCEILAFSFKNCKFITFSGFTVSFADNALKSEDKIRLTEFFSLLGTAEKQTEAERTELYLQMFKAEAQKARAEADSKCKIYTVSGVSLGLVTAVLFV